MNADSVVEFNDVCKSFGDIEAVRDLSLTIRRGEVVAILGPNGAGKTTTLAMLLGLRKPTSGRLSVFGLAPGHLSCRLSTGTMLQISGLPSSLKVEEHIRLFSSYYATPIPTERVIERCGLGELKDRSYGDLSSGQQQKVHYAIAICGDPKLLILDEPTVSLDVESRRTLWDDLTDATSSNRTILIATHNLEEADLLADRIILLANGRLIADASPEEIKSQVPGKTIIAKTGISDAEVANLSGVVAHRRDGESLHIYVENAETPLRELLAIDSRVTDIEVTSADLEDAFMNLLKQERD